VINKWRDKLDYFIDRHICDGITVTDGYSAAAGDGSYRIRKMRRCFLAHCIKNWQVLRCAANLLR